MAQIIMSARALEYHEERRLESRYAGCDNDNIAFIAVEDLVS